MLELQLDQSLENKEKISYIPHEKFYTNENIRNDIALEQKEKQAERDEAFKLEKLKAQEGKLNEYEGLIDKFSQTLDRKILDKALKIKSKLEDEDIVDK